MSDLNISDFMDWVVARNPGEEVFHQAVHEVAEVIIPYIKDNNRYLGTKILHRMTEPDRAISFRVTWQADDNEVHVNRGYRVQFNNSIGP
ncbi:MAG: Glu/Leu/Phe/Val dehydrogenase dimerization domain-containing protein, partial [Pseudomonadota bacterium]